MHLVVLVENVGAACPNVPPLVRPRCGKVVELRSLGQFAIGLGHHPLGVVAHVEREVAYIVSASEREHHPAEALGVDARYLVLHGIELRCEP